MNYSGASCQKAFQARPPTQRLRRPDAGATVAVTEIVLAKAARAGDGDRAYLRVAGVNRRGRSTSSTTFPTSWSNPSSASTTASGASWPAARTRHRPHAATARDPKRRKQGRIASGAAAGATTDEWLTPGHRLAKTITNCVVNRWGDGADTPAGVRARAARDAGDQAAALLGRVDDETIALAIPGVRDLVRRWRAEPPGGRLELSWPLQRPSFTP